MLCESQGARRPSQAGFSLVELMVALAISLIVSLAIFAVLNNSEGRKRTSNAINDVNQVGSYASYIVDRSIRSAGSGFSANWGVAFGCALTAARDNQPLLPSAAAFPAPFAAVPTGLRLAPVLIVSGGADDASDSIVVMAGTAGFGEAGARVLANISGNEARVRNSVGFRGGDMVLINDPSSGQCLVSQISAAFAGDGTAKEVPLAGAYLTEALGSDADINNFSAGSLMLGVGNPATNPPQFQLIGVDDNQTLVGLDLLRTNGNAAPVPMAENVLLMRAMYGVDTTGDKQFDAWVMPTKGTEWDADILMDGSPTSQANLRNIVAVRLAMVMRSSLIERTPVSAETLRVFAGQQGAFDLDVDTGYRYRIFEVTVPVRNNLMP